MEAFFTYLDKVKSSVNVAVLRPNRQKESARSLTRFKELSSRLEAGWYICHAGEHVVEHCFAFKSSGPGLPVQVVDKFDEDATPPFDFESPDNLQWIKRIRSIRRVEMKPFVSRKRARKV